MIPDQIDLVRDSFRKLLPIKSEAAALFYGRLFEIAPDVRAMFTGDLTAQGAKLMGALAFVVAGLDKLEQIIPDVQALARRHVGYGVKESHYAAVGEALIWTLEQGLGRAFTPKVRQAWLEAYGILAEAMIAAARNVPERIVKAA
jgi:hemoglobin-like flavoprotein